MTRDKQLLHIDLDQMIERHRLTQALNSKKFAVLAGISNVLRRGFLAEAG